MDLSKSRLATMSTQINHKEKNLFVVQMLELGNKGKRILATVNDKRDLDFLMFTQEDWILVKSYIGKLNIMPVSGKTVIE